MDQPNSMVLVVYKRNDPGFVEDTAADSGIGPVVGKVVTFSKLESLPPLLLGVGRAVAINSSWSDGVGENEEEDELPSVVGTKELDDELEDPRKGVGLAVGEVLAVATVGTGVGDDNGVVDGKFRSA